MVSFKRILLLIFAVLLLAACGNELIPIDRPPPPAISEKAYFQGITYVRDVRAEPRPMVIHVMSIDLTAPGIEFLVTPADFDDEYQFAARRTSTFLEEYDLQVAINGDYFYPFFEFAYPQEGDGVNISGYAVSRGELLTEDASPRSHTLFISEDNRAWMGRRDEPDAFNAVSGNVRLLDAGEYAQEGQEEQFMIDVEPRTGVAVSEDGETLLLFVVDGRQPGYSEGASMRELAAIMLAFGGYDGMNLDGGGSSTMVIEAGDGQPQVMNSPIHTRIPGRERPVANHLGVYALSR